MERTQKPNEPVQRKQEEKQDGGQVASQSPPGFSLTASTAAAPAQMKTGEEKVLDQVKTYDEYISEASAKYGIPVEQIRSLIAVESAGKSDASSGAAWGLMQITKQTWGDTQGRFPELAKYDFASYWDNPRINIFFGAATFKTKMKTVGVGTDDPNFASLAITAYNAGEGTVKKAIRNAQNAGSKDPNADALKPEYLKPAIEATRIYRYYLTGGGKKRNKSGTVSEAVDLKYQEVSRYPTKVAKYLALQKGDTETSNDKDNAPANDSGQSESATPIGEGKVTAGGLNVRQGPGSNFPKAGKALVRGAQVTIYGEQDGWYNVGQGRWVSAKYVEKSESKGEAGNSGPIDSGSVIASMLNVRSGPASSFAKKGNALKQGTQVEVFEKKDGWLRIGIDMWISGKYVELKGQTNEGGGKPAPAPANRQGFVTASSLNVRTTNSPTAKRVDTLSRGTQVTIYEEKAGWYRVGEDQWVSGRYIQIGTPGKTGGGGSGKGTGPKPNWVSIAEGEVGVKEIKGSKHNSRILEYHATTGKFGQDEVPWCASFVNWVYGKAGQPTTGSARALSFQNYGKKLSGPAYGALAVFSWGGGKGHVGFVVGKQGDRILVLGGNQSDSVKVSSFATNQVVSYVVPEGYEVPSEAYNLGGAKEEVEDGGGLAATR